MARQSKIVTAITFALTNGKLRQPFTVSDLNSACKDLLTKSHSFLSKHRENYPGVNTVYFEQDKNGKYLLI